MSPLNVDTLSALGPLDTMASTARPPDAESGVPGGFDEHLARAGRPDAPAAPPPAAPSGEEDRHGTPDETPGAEPDQGSTRPAGPGNPEADRDGAGDASGPGEAAQASQPDTAPGDTSDAEEPEKKEDAQAAVQGALAVEVAAAIVPEENAPADPVQADLPPGVEASDAGGVETDAAKKTPPGPTEVLLEEQTVQPSGQAEAARREDAGQPPSKPAASSAGPVEVAKREDGQPPSKLAAGTAGRADGESPEASGTDPEASDSPGKRASRATPRASGPPGASPRVSEPATDSQHGAATATPPAQVVVQEASTPQVTAAGREILRHETRAESDPKPTPPAISAGQSPAGVAQPGPEAAAVGGGAGSSGPGAQIASPSTPGGAAEHQNGPPTDQIDRVRFVGRVARALETASGRAGSLRLRLHPPHLGSLRLEMTVENGVMTARLEADSAAARNLLLDHLPVLRERLAQQNIKVQRFDVGLGMNSSGGSPQGPNDQQHGLPFSPRNESPAEATENRAEADRAISGSPAGPSQFDVTI